MEHEQLALISPALLDKILNHLEGGQKNAKSESTHVRDTNIHQTLLQQDVANMNDALFLSLRRRGEFARGEKLRGLHSS